MRYGLRTLLILMTVGPPVLVGLWMARRDLMAVFDVELNVTVSIVVVGLLALWMLSASAAVTVEAIETVRARLQNRR